MSDETKLNNEVDELQAQLEKLARIRQGFAAHLGESFYEVTKDDSLLRIGRERLYDGIAKCDEQTARIKARIEELQAAPEPELAPEPEPEPAFVSEPESMQEPAIEPSVEVAPEYPSDPVVVFEGAPEPTPQPESQTEPVPVPKQAIGPNVCPHCGSPVEPTHKFCMTCGAKLGE